MNEQEGQKVAMQEDPLERRIFRGVSAVVARLRGVANTQYADLAAILALDPKHDWSNGATFPVDLTNLKQVSLLDRIVDDVGLDTAGQPLKPDFKIGDGPTVTTIGPWWPKNRFAGAVFLLEREFILYRSHIEEKEQWPTSEKKYKAEQFVTLRYPRAVGSDVRYMGFTVQVTEGTTIADYKVKFRLPGTDSFSQPTLLDPRSVDGSVEQTLLGSDAISNVLPVTNATLNVDYAVFVELGYVATSLWRQYGLATPKLPFWMR